MADHIPQPLEETILTYLKDQEDFMGNYEIQDFQELAIRQEPTVEDHVALMLDELLTKVNKRIACKDRYENLKCWHNQFPLFDISHIIPDYCMSYQVMKSLAFKESLLISEVDSTSDLKEVEPQPIGTLCLNVQIEDGRTTKDKCASPDEELEQEISRVALTTKMLRKKPFVVTEYDEKVKKVLEEYDKILAKKTRHDIKKFVIHLSSQFDWGDAVAGSSITSWVDRYFHTIEERRKEWIRKEGKTTQKILYAGLQKDRYYVHQEFKPMEDRKMYHNLSKAKDYISEGANFVLMRYLAIINYQGTFELSTLYINGDLCRNIYECTGYEKGNIENKIVDICKIYRYIIEQNGLEHRSVTVLTPNGQIISQEWDGCPVILNRNPLVFLGTKHLYERKILTKTWINDMELLSKYLDCKTEAEKKMKTYENDHTEVRKLVADYLNNILLLKPDNILHFTTDYFQSVCNIDLGKESYFERDPYEFD